MPYPYFCPSGFSGSSACTLSSHCCWKSALKTLPDTSARIQFRDVVGGGDDAAGRVSVGRVLVGVVDGLQRAGLRGGLHVGGVGIVDHRIGRPPIHVAMGVRRRHRRRRRRREATSAATPTARTGGPATAPPTDGRRPSPRSARAARSWCCCTRRRCWAGHSADARRRSPSTSCGVQAFARSASSSAENSGAFV